MTVKRYSLTRDGNKHVSKNFQVWEFASRDGADTVLICHDLVENILQPARDLFDGKIMITSAYRTLSHNRYVGSGDRSQHVLGKAADIRIFPNNGAQLPPKEAVVYFDKQNIGGLGLYRTMCHTDTRRVRARWDSSSGIERSVDTFIPTPADAATNFIKLGEISGRVTWLQVKLNNGAAELVVDGIFGPATEMAVEAFQRRQRIKVDGIVGPQTLSYITGERHYAPSAKVDYSNFPNLRKGDRNEHVKIMQQGLIDRGYDIPAGATGNYLDQTESAALAFLKNVNLLSYRVESMERVIWGPKCWKALFN